MGIIVRIPCPVGAAERNRTSTPSPGQPPQGCAATSYATTAYRTSTRPRTGARERTRTSTPFPGPAPEAGAATISPHAHQHAVGHSIRAQSTGSHDHPRRVLVRAAGVEPACASRLRILNPARLPVPPRPHQDAPLMSPSGDGARPGGRTPTISRSASFEPAASTIPPHGHHHQRMVGVIGLEPTASPSRTVRSTT